MKVIWATALLLAVFSAEALSEQGTMNPFADEWSCDYKSNGKTFTQKWTVANESDDCAIRERRPPRHT